MRATKIRLLFAVFSVCFVIFYFEVSVRAPRAHRTTVLNLLGSHTLTHIFAFVSALRTTPRTANMCGNTIPCFAPLSDRGDRTNWLHWLELLYTSYISLLNQAGKGRVFYSNKKCFQTGGDPHNIIDKQILKIWTPCLSAFYCVIPRATLTQRLRLHSGQTNGHSREHARDLSTPGQFSSSSHKIPRSTSAT